MDILWLICGAGKGGKNQRDSNNTPERDFAETPDKPEAPKKEVRAEQIDVREMPPEIDSEPPEIYSGAPASVVHDETRLLVKEFSGKRSS